MKIEVIKTRAMMPPQDDLWRVIEESITDIPERSIVVVTSKVVAIHQGRCVKIGEGIERDELARQEADLYVDRDIVPGEHLMFTIKYNTLIASAGIDKSNGNGYFVLWPEEPDRAAREIHRLVKKKFGVREVGVLITDSHVIPLRRGTVGMAIGHWGFNPLRDYIGQPDIFGKPLVVTRSNITEALAAAAVVVMGEANEQTPLALITDIPWVEFSEDEQVNAGVPSVKIPIEEDLFSPMLEAVKWQKGGGT